MAKYRVNGTVTWPDSHPSSPTKEWEGVYEAKSKDEAAALGVKATTDAWKLLGALSVQATEVELAGD